MDLVTVLRWAAAALLACGALWLSIVNWLALVRRFTRQSAPSWIPLVGGLLGAAAVLVEPTGRLARFWWTPFLLDAGSVPGFLTTAVWLAVKRPGSTGSSP